MGRLERKAHSAVHSKKQKTLILEPAEIARLDPLRY